MFTELLFGLFLVGAYAQNNTYCPYGSFDGLTAGQCFKIDEKAKNFFDAQKDCINSYNGSLASIHDAFTNSLIAKQANSLEFFKDPIWTGGTNYQESTWVWVDMTNFTYKNWDFLQPSLFGGDCIYLSVNNGKWTNENCLRNLAYVCEYKVALSTTTTSTTVNPNLTTTTAEPATTTTRISTQPPSSSTHRIDTSSSSTTRRSTPLFRSTQHNLVSTKKSLKISF